LAPPLLNGEGDTREPKKRSFGPWMLQGFKLLAKFKGVRNTWLDPFGHTRERKVERRWLANYEAILDEVLAGLNSERLPLAQALTALPNSVRGFGPVKDRFLASAEQRQAQLLDEWRNGPAEPVEAVQFVDASKAAGKITVTQL
jgi:indolepyruvate ferredoxin oxidoreductase